MRALAPVTLTPAPGVPSIPQGERMVFVVHFDELSANGLGLGKRRSSLDTLFREGTKFATFIQGNPTRSWQLFGHPGTVYASDAQLIR
jgi:hypothetical protein